jgi:hypothetical protein
MSQRKMNQVSGNCNRVKLAELFFVLMVLFGCATLNLPPPDVMKADVSSYQLPKLAEDGQAIVYVARPSDYFGSVSLSVFVDSEVPGSKVGATTGKQYISFSLSPGNHKILSRGENLAEVDVSAKAGDVIFILQEAAMPILNEARNSLSVLNEYEGKYLVKNITNAPVDTGLISYAVAATNSKGPPAAPQAPAQTGSKDPTPPGTSQTEPSLAGPVFVGTITGGNWAKGIGFSNINIKYIVASDSGAAETFFIRSDSKIIDVSGNQMKDYTDAWGKKGHRVEIQHFIIQDATGGEPGRTDFAYEIGQKGVRVLRFLN